MTLIPFLSTEILRDEKESGRLFVYDSESDSGYVIDGLAANLCSRFTGRARLQKIVDDMINERNLPKSVFLRDVENLLGELERLKVITWVDEPL